MIATILTRGFYLAGTPSDPDILRVNSGNTQHAVWRLNISTHAREDLSDFTRRGKAYPESLKKGSNAAQMLVGYSCSPALRRWSSSRATVMSCPISPAALTPIFSTSASASSEETRGFSPLPSAWRRAISPRTAVTMKFALVSPGCSDASMPLTTSCGNLAFSCCDLLLTELVDMFAPPINNGMQCNIKVNTKKDLKWYSPNCNLNTTRADICNSAIETTKPGSARTLTGLLTTSDSKNIEAAMRNHNTLPQRRDTLNQNNHTRRFIVLNSTCGMEVYPRIYAALDCNVKSKWIASYGNTIFPFSSWSITPAFNSACTSLCTPRKSRPILRDNSRMDIASAPVIALIICRRPDESMVLESDSISGNVSVKGSLMDCPDITAVKDFLTSSNASLVDITRMTSVFIKSPPESVHIVKKLPEQIIQIVERDGKFSIAYVLVIPFPGFIVIAHNTDILNNISEAVFVTVLTPCNRGINSPHSNADKRILIREVVAFFNDQISRHDLFSLTDDNYNITKELMTIMSSPGMESLKKSLPLCGNTVYGYKAPHKTGAGIGLPLTIEAIHDAPASFFVSVHAHTLSMVGCMGLPSGRLVSLIASKANSVQSTASKIGLLGGGYKPSIKEAAAMLATTPTQKPQFIWLISAVRRDCPTITTQIHHIAAKSERDARRSLVCDPLYFFAVRIRQEVAA